MAEFKIPPVIFDKIWRSKRATRKYVEKVLEEKIKFNGKKVLDFGCGTGSYSFLFDSEGYLGVDIDSKRIKYAKKNYPRYKFEQINSKSLKRLNKKFDLIFIVSTIHHIRDTKMKKHLEELFNLLKSNGRIVGMEPCFFKNSTFNNWFMKWTDRGKYIRTEEAYKNLFKRLFNFNPVKKFKRHFVYNELFYIASKKQKKD